VASIKSALAFTGISMRKKNELMKYQKFFNIIENIVVGQKIATKELYM